MPGDDVRLIDWNVTARTGEPHVRVQLAERVLVTWIVLDHTAVDGVRHGRPPQGGRRAGRRARARARGERAREPRRPVAFGGGAERCCRRRRGAPGLVGVLLALARRAWRRRCRPAPTARRALRGLAAVARQRALVGVVSDFRGPLDWRRPLLDLAGRHDVLAVEIRDPREQELATSGSCGSSTPRRASGCASTRATRGLRERFAAAAPRSGGGGAGARVSAGVATSCSRPTATGCATSRVVRAAEAAMSFVWPVALARAARVPAARRAPVRRRAPARREAAALRNPRARRRVSSPRPPGVRRLRAVRPRARGVRVPRRRVARARTSSRRDARRGDVILTIDTSRSMAGDGRAAVASRPPTAAARRSSRRCPTRSASASSPSRPRPTSCCRRPPTARPRGRRSTQLRLGSGTALGDAIDRSVELALATRGRASRPRDRQASPGGRPPALGRRPDRRAASRPSAAAQRARGSGAVSTVALGTRDAVVEVPRPGGLTERVTVAPDCRRCAGWRRRPVGRSPRRRRGAPEGGLPRARHPARRRGASASR